MPARTRDYTDKVEDVLSHAREYHAAYYEAEIFAGPSLYFHQRCVGTLGDGITDQRLEYVYATLASWGMHRMGRGGSKMRPFDDFRDSVVASKALIEQLQTTQIVDVGPGTWDILGKIFRQVRIMATGTTIVGNSKVMAHLLPNLVPPIDRQYTLRYLRGNTNITNNLDAEWLTMGDLLQNFFYPVALDSHFIDAAEDWAACSEIYAWDTSPLKTVDNLLIGAVKSQT